MDVFDQYMFVAEKSPVHSKFAAIITHRNKVISYGYNYVTDISSKNADCCYEPNKHSVHAERHAIMNTKNKALLRKCNIIIFKITYSGVVKECRPCEMCQKLLDKYHLKQKIVTND